MEDKLCFGTFCHLHENGERKTHNGHRDVKRKLSFINKKIGDLQHQRKFIYKNSSKIKKIVHNQVNQVVKCLRARERSLWADVDDVHIAQDENISEELARLQSVHARCQVLLEHFDDNRRTADIFDNIYSILSEVKFGEKQDVKALEFVSNFETMKDMASDFGHLDGDFIKRDGFVFKDKKENVSSDPVCREFHLKKSCSEKVLPSNITEGENSNNGSSNWTESEDSFEIVDLLENMCCEEIVKDSVMDEQENCGSCSQQIEYESESRSELLKGSNGLESSQKALNSFDFNPEEEWKQIFEMRNKIANFTGITSALSDESKNCETQNTVHNFLTADNCHDINNKQNAYTSPKEFDSWLCDRSSRKEKLSFKSSKQNKFVFLKEADSWLQNRSLEKDALKKEKNLERIDTGINSDASPAELIQQAFTSYLTKDDIQNWLLHN